MAVLRFFAWVLFLVAMIALVSDLTRAANGAAFSITTGFAYWNTVAPQSLAAAAVTIQKSVHPLMWDPVIMRLLLLPIWVLIGAVGLLFAVLGRKKRRVNIFAN